MVVICFLACLAVGEMVTTRLTLFFCICREVDKIQIIYS